MLRWNGSDDDGDGLTYDIYLGTNNPPTDIVVADHPSNTYSPSGLAGETTYFWRVVAKDGHGGTTSGPVWSFTTVAKNRAPDAPENPTPAHGSTDKETPLTFSWSASDPEDDPLRYDIYLGTVNPPTQLIASNRTSASFGSSVLIGGKTYYWRVVVRDDHGGVTNGPVWSFTTAWVEPPLVSPVAFYQFSGNANDASGNGHHGEVFGATLTTDRDGESNKAYMFGNGKFIVVPHASELTMAQNDFTVAAWIKPSANQSKYAGIVVKCTPTAPEHGYQMVMQDGNRFAGQYGTDMPAGQVYFDVIGNALSAGEWHYVAMVLRRTENSVRLYVDGVLQKETIDSHLSYSMENNSPLHIGTERQEKIFFDGAIDEVRIYNQALTTSQIQALAAQ